MFGELMAVVGLANQTNSLERLPVPIDQALKIWVVGGASAAQYEKRRIRCSQGYAHAIALRCACGGADAATGGALFLISS
jgi:hypothetical protein